MDVQFADTPGVNFMKEGVDCGVITAGVFMVDQHPGFPFDSFACTVGVGVVIAMSQVEGHRQGKDLTPLQTCGYEVLVIVFTKIEDHR